MTGAHTIAGVFALVLATIDRTRATGCHLDTAIGYAAGRHNVSIQTATALHTARELRELERLALLAESQNLGALLRRQGD